MKEKKFKKGDLVWVQYLKKKHRYDVGCWVKSLGIIISSKNTLQIAKIYIQNTGEFLERVPYKFIKPTNIEKP